MASQSPSTPRQHSLPFSGPSAAERERARWLAAELERHNYL
ncbi:hypothetical protein [uncultured Desulfovibrio sp.]|nr:hypothetical protein [uncultured Desulfovibrio sp.]